MRGQQTVAHFSASVARKVYKREMNLCVAEEERDFARLLLNWNKICARMNSAVAGSYRDAYFCSLVISLGDEWDFFHFSLLFPVFIFFPTDLIKMYIFEYFLLFKRYLFMSNQDSYQKQQNVNLVHKIKLRRRNYKTLLSWYSIHKK